MGTHDEYRAYHGDTHGATPLEVDRGCTDSPCLLLFMAACGLLGGTLYYASEHGAIQRLLAVPDFQGNLCGYGGDGSFAFFCQNSSGYLDLDHQVCVPTCPTSESDVVSCYQAATGKFQEMPGYPTEAVAGIFCMPKKTERRKQFMSLLTGDSFLEHVVNLSEVPRAWLLLLNAALVSTALAFVYLWFIQEFARPLMWLGTFLVISGTGGLGGLLIYSSYNGGVDHIPSSGDGQYDLIIGSIGATISFLLVCVILCKGVQMNRGMECLANACQAITHNPTLLLEPWVSTLCKVLIFVPLLGGFFLLLSVGRVRHAAASVVATSTTAMSMEPLTSSTMMPTPLPIAPPVEVDPTLPSALVATAVPAATRLLFGASDLPSWNQTGSIFHEHASRAAEHASRAADGIRTAWSEHNVSDRLSTHLSHASEHVHHASAAALNYLGNKTPQMQEHLDRASAKTSVGLHHLKGHMERAHAFASNLTKEDALNYTRTAATRVHTAASNAYKRHAGTIKRIASTVGSWDLTDIPFFAFEPLEYGMMAFYVLMMLWILELCHSMSCFVVTYTIELAFFVHRHEHVKDEHFFSVFGMTRAYCVALRYHLGSLLFGSIAIALLRLPRIFMGAITRSARDNNPVGLCLGVLCGCCVNCYEKYLEPVKKDAYMDMVMNSTGFCEAGRHALQVIRHQATMVATLHGATWLFSLAGIGGITAATTALTWLGATKWEKFSNPESQLYIEDPLYVCSVAAAISLIVVVPFMHVFDTVSDTTLYCIAYEEQRKPIIVEEKKTGCFTNRPSCWYSCFTNRTAEAQRLLGNGLATEVD